MPNEKPIIKCGLSGEEVLNLLHQYISKGYSPKEALQMLYIHELKKRDNVVNSLL